MRSWLGPEGTAAAGPQARAHAAAPAGFTKGTFLSAAFGAATRRSVPRILSAQQPPQEEGEEGRLSSGW
jgi:hypothetical protein